MKNNEINTPPKHLSPNTGFLLSWVSAASNLHYEDAIKNLNLNPHHVGVLELVAAQQPVVQSRISEQLGIFKPVMVTLINQLEKRGYVQRRPHPTDKRALEIHLLPEGKACLDQVRNVSKLATDAFFNALSPTERQQFHSFLAKIADSNKLK